MSSQSMKPATAAKKLDVYLPATPEDFRAGPITRADIAVAIRIVEIVSVLLVWGWFWLMVKSMRRQIRLVATGNRA